MQKGQEVLFPHKKLLILGKTCCCGTYPRPGGKVLRWYQISITSNKFKLLLLILTAVVVLPTICKHT